MTSTEQAIWSPETEQNSSPVFAEARGVMAKLHEVLKLLEQSVDEMGYDQLVEAREVLREIQRVLFVREPQQIAEWRERYEPKPYYPPYSATLNSVAPLVTRSGSTIGGLL